MPELVHKRALITKASKSSNAMLWHRPYARTVGNMFASASGRDVPERSQWSLDPRLTPEQQVAQAEQLVEFGLTAKTLVTDGLQILDFLVAKGSDRHAAMLTKLINAQMLIDSTQASLSMPETLRMGLAQPQWSSTIREGAKRRQNERVRRGNHFDKSCSEKNISGYSVSPRP